MKLLFDEGTELIVWSENDSISMTINGQKKQLNGEDLFHFQKFIYDHTKKVIQEQEKQKSIFDKLKELWKN